MAELVVLVIALLVAGVFVLAPLRWSREAAPVLASGDLEVAELRHRVALDALRDVEADRRSGSLDTTGYAHQRVAAEDRATATLAELDAAVARLEAVRAERQPSPAIDSRSRRLAAGVALAIGATLLVGLAAPAPIGLANTMRVDEQRAAALRADQERQLRITSLLERLDEDPRNVVLLLDLADAYLAGDSRDDLVRAATVLTVVIGERPDSVEAHLQIITAYIRAGDYVNARAALDALRELDADPADVAFFTGLVALRGEEDPAAAVAAFDRFLELAPEDDRAPMARALRTEAARQNP